jgi:hypothetical protein
MLNVNGLLRRSFRFGDTAAKYKARLAAMVHTQNTEGSL